MAVSSRRDSIRDLVDLADSNAKRPEIRACGLRLLSNLGFLSPGLVHMSPCNQLPQRIPARSSARQQETGKRGS